MIPMAYYYKCPDVPIHPHDDIDDDIVVVRNYEPNDARKRADALIKQIMESMQ